MFVNWRLNFDTHLITPAELAAYKFFLARVLEIRLSRWILNATYPNHLGHFPSLFPCHPPLGTLLPARQLRPWIPGCIPGGALFPTRNKDFLGCQFRGTRAREKGIRPPGAWGAWLSSAPSHLIKADPQFPPAADPRLPPTLSSRNYPVWQNADHFTHRIFFSFLRLPCGSVSGAPPSVHLMNQGRNFSLPPPPVASSPIHLRDAL